MMSISISKLSCSPFCSSYVYIFQRIFDFDASGICDKTRLKWKRNPLPWAAYYYVIDNCKKNALITAPWGENSKKFSKKKTSIIKKICKKKSLTKFDEIIYFAVFGDILYP